MSPEKVKMLKGFVIKAIIAMVVWQVVYHAFIVPDGRLNKFLTQTVLNGTAVGLNMLGYDAERVNSIVEINGEPVVLVADGCNGLELFALYAGFLLCFPGRWKYKAIFIPSGILLIYLINVAREMALALNYKFFQETFEFNHKYTYVFIVYIFVFVLWRFWLNRYSSLARK